MDCSFCQKNSAQYRESGPNGNIFCSKLCQSEYHAHLPLKIRIVTWNLGDNKKTQSEWMTELEQKWDVLTKTDEFHILFLTIQESQKFDTFGKALRNRLKDYNIFSASSKLLAPAKFYVHSYVFFHHKLNIGPENVSRASTCLKTFCTKSTTGLSIDKNGVELIFMGSHFPVNPKDKLTLGNEERIQAAKKSLKDVFLPLATTKKNYAAFWAGDFNFRQINGKDQLAQAMPHFKGFKEGEINFPPTCKMRKDCDRPQSDTVEIPECYVTKRSPSYCDRVLYHSKSIKVDLLSYQSYGDAPAIQNSDHNLVYADFLVFL